MINIMKNLFNDFYWIIFCCIAFVAWYDVLVPFLISLNTYTFDVIAVLAIVAPIISIIAYCFYCLTSKTTDVKSRTDGLSD